MVHGRRYAGEVTRTALALRLVIPAFWLGLIVAISFIEAPLKFLAPGITIPLGLGIGRLVFTTVNIVGLLLLLMLTAVSVWPRQARLERRGSILLGLLWLVLLVELISVGPLPIARTDIVLAGGEPGQSPWHYIYIAADLVLVGLLVAFIVLVVRALIPRHAPALTSV